MHQGFSQGNSGPSGHHLSGPLLQGPPRGPPPSQIGKILFVIKMMQAKVIEAYKQ